MKPCTELGEVPQFDQKTCAEEEELIEQIYGQDCSGLLQYSMQAYELILFQYVDLKIINRWKSDHRFGPWGW